jgi:hypothetical protein
MNDIRRLSMDEARSLATQIAGEFVRSSGWEDGPLGAEPDRFVSDRRGRTPVRWLVTFRTVRNGVEYDGPRLVAVDIETGRASLAPAG